MSIINKIQVIQNESIAGANTKERVSDVLTDINNLINSNLTSVNGYINQQIATIPPVDLSNYDTSAQVDNKIASIVLPITLANTAFVEIPYTATITKIYNDLIPNNKIVLAGNLTYTITGTVNGDSGILELSNCVGRTIALNGLLSITIVGSTETIVFSFINSGLGIIWIPENLNTAPVETDKANSQGTILYHSIHIENRGSVSVSGNTVTGTGTFFFDGLIGSRFTINGNHYIITAVASLTSMTINTVLTATAINGNWGIFNRAVVITPTGKIEIYQRSSTDATIVIEENGALKVNNLESLNNISSSNDIYLNGEIINFRINGGITLRSPNGTSFTTRVNNLGVLETL